MQKSIIIFFTACFIVISPTFYSQTNFVPNPSFETYSTCPNSIGIIPSNWFNFGGSPDYYNSCANFTSSPSVGVPSNWIGYQSAYDGNGYIGISTYYSGSQREYIASSLSQTLNIGTKYFVSAYISRQDTSNGSVGNACSASNFGFKFSTVAFSYSTPIIPSNFAHVYSSTIINDTLGWTKISGSFIADSSYLYLSIGNFFDNSNTNTNNCIYPSSIAYYYVDKVCVSTDSTLCNTSTSSQDLKFQNNISIYPNPTINNFTVQIPPHFKNCRLQLFDVVGNEVLSSSLLNEKNTFDISSLQCGVFYLKINYQNQYYNYKLIKHIQ